MLLAGSCSTHSSDRKRQQEIKSSRFITDDLIQMRVLARLHQLTLLGIIGLRGSQSGQTMQHFMFLHCLLLIDFPFFESKTTDAKLTACMH